MPGRIVAQAEIGLPKAAIWEGLRDLTRARFYVPGVTDIIVTTPAREGIGASRRVFMKSGKPVDETVIAWKESGGMRLRLHQGDGPPAPFPEAWFEYAIAESGPERTVLTCVFEYTPPWGVAGPIANRLLFRPLVGRSLRATADGFKRHYETGAVTNAAYSGPAAA